MSDGRKRGHGGAEWWQPLRQAGQWMLAESRRVMAGARSLWTDLRRRQALLRKDPQSLTRTEWRHILLTGRDVARLVPLGVFLFAFPGSTLILPLLTLGYPKILPAAMRSPALNERLRLDLLTWRRERVGTVVKTMQQRLNLFQAGRRAQSSPRIIHIAEAAPGSGESPATAPTGSDFSDAELLDFLDVTTMPALSYLDWVGLAHYYEVPLWKRLLLPQASVQAIASDLDVEDSYIEREGLDSLTAEEILEACVERGFVLDRRSGEDLARARSVFEGWMLLRSHRSISRDLKMYFGPLMTHRIHKGRASSRYANVLADLLRRRLRR